MSTLLRKLKSHLEREGAAALAGRVRQNALDAVRYLSHVSSAKVALRQCTQVGAWTRTAGGRPVVENRGRLVLGPHVLLTSTFSPVHLTTGPHGSLEIGAGSVINFGTAITAKRSVKIGSSVNIGPYCVLSDETPFAPPFEDHAVGEPIEIADRVWLAGGVTVEPGARIGLGSVILAGSKVSGEIPPGVVAGGSPARVLRPLIEPQPSANTNAQPSERPKLRSVPAPDAAAESAPSSAVPPAPPRAAEGPATGVHVRPPDEPLASADAPESGTFAFPPGVTSATRTDTKLPRPTSDHEGPESTEPDEEPS